jgi:hypothetical protein
MNRPAGVHGGDVSRAGAYERRVVYVLFLENLVRLLNATTHCRSR